MMDDPSVMSSANLLDLFEVQAQTRPADTAIVLESGPCHSYAELNSAATDIALVCLAHLGDAAIGPASPLVSVLVNRHLGTMACILAVLKCGAGYVPVDPSFPSERQAHIFAHSQSALLIADEESFRKASSFGIALPPTIVVSTAGRIVDTHNLVLRDAVSFPLVRAAARQRVNGGVFYVLYTSGSTGKPKGVECHARGVHNTVTWFAAQLKASESTRVLGLTTYCFDISLVELFLPIIVGGTLVLAESSSQRNPFRVMDVMRERAVNVFQATPTSYEMLLAAGWKGDPQMDLIVGGEAFRPSKFPLLDNCKSFRNGYGPTEACIYASAYLLPRHSSLIPVSEKGVVRVPVGSPVDGNLFYLVADETKPVTDLTIGDLSDSLGELWIGGVGVATGYLNAPDLTAARFIPNPFGPGTVYRTGDLVQRLAGGEYVFVKRLDDQVKIDGFRIELAEIENVYCEHMLVEQAVVVVRQNTLVAYLKLRGAETLSQNTRRELHAHIGKHLTHYMLPKYAVQVREFTLTASGKLDRLNLPPHNLDTDSNVFDRASSITTEGTDADWRSCRRSMADHICDIIEAIRGRRPKPFAYFTTVGVDSLGAVLFIRNLSDTLGGYRIDPARIYAPNVTIAMIAREIHEHLAASNPSLLADLGITCTLADYEQRNSMEGGKGDGADANDAVERDFEGGVLSNIRLLEGLRGILSFMILWDHYHPIDTFYSGNWEADTYLFVILSGFTTSLQIRDLPEMSASGDALKSRPMFDWKSFLVGKFTGIYPLLWLALIVYVPFWKQNDEKHIAAGEFTVEHSIQCVPLYVLALQSWVRPQCSTLGPHEVFYSSILWSLFIIYGVIRVSLFSVQNYVMDWSATSWGPQSLAKRIGGITTMLSYSRPSVSVAIGMAAFWTLFFTGVFILDLRVIYFRVRLSSCYLLLISALTIIFVDPYYFLGSLSRRLCSCLHYRVTSLGNVEYSHHSRQLELE